MNTFHVVATMSLIMLTASSNAQYVTGNEAVRLLPNGTKQVDTPPEPANVLAKPCPATQAGCAGGGWNMVETAHRLSECTEIYARPGTCRASTYGKEKLSRVWIVKRRSEWLQCPYPDLASKCVSTKALPISAVQ